MLNKENLIKIINKYGVSNQLKYIQSEFFEFTEAVIKYEEYEKNKNENFYSKKKSDLMKKHIAEELSDVMCMLKQFQLHYDFNDEDIQNIINFKSNRELNRIKEREE